MPPGAAVRPGVASGGLIRGEALRRRREGARGYQVKDEAGRMAGLCTRTDFYNSGKTKRQAPGAKQLPKS